MKLPTLKRYYHVSLETTVNNWSVNCCLSGELTDHEDEWVIKQIAKDNKLSEVNKS